MNVWEDLESIKGRKTIVFRVASPFFWIHKQCMMKNNDEKINIIWTIFLFSTTFLTP
jgi:hypothetical protein